MINKKAGEGSELEIFTNDLIFQKNLNLFNILLEEDL